MKIYLVGGAVRDILLGAEPKDRDYVVVGATPEDVENMLASGFQRVGADFPVFLHPETGDEYALARIERKVGVGYNGFEAFTSPDLTLKDDLMRRDLTINAMAMDPTTGEIFDYFGGQEDLRMGVIRHVSTAFAEDPLRVLRAGRFAARYNFKIAPDTKELMKQLVDTGELDHLTRERVWVEIEKMLGETGAHAGIKALLEVGALQRLFGKGIADAIENLVNLPNDRKKFMALDAVGKFCWFSLGCDWSDKQMQEMKIPRHFQQAHVMFDKSLFKFDMLLGASAEEMMEFLEVTAALKTSNTFESIKEALGCSFVNISNRRFDLIEKAKQAALSVDCEAIASSFKDGKKIAEAIRAERVKRIVEVV